MVQVVVNHPVLLVDAVRQMNEPDAKAVVFRRTTKELRQLIDYSQMWYPKPKWQMESTWLILAIS